VPYSSGVERIIVGDVAARLFGGSPEARLALLRATWRHVAGPELARRTEVLAIEGQTLRIRVSDARWRKVLHRMQPELIPRLRRLAAGAAPQRLGFTEGGLAAPVNEPPPQPTRYADWPVPHEVEVASRAISDEEMRQSFLEVAGRYLRRSACAKP
jgi:hypothetical protein